MYQAQFGVFLFEVSMLNTGIYEIRNIKTNDFYIGSASSLKDRKRQHFTALRLGDHHNTHLQNSYNKHGLNSFVFKILTYCNKDMLIYFEQRFIDFMKPTYNKRLVAESNIGIKRSDEARKNISEAHKGIKYLLSDERRKELRDSMLGNVFAKAIIYTDELREKKRLSMLGKNKGKIPTDETRKKWSDIRKGKKQSEITKQKRSISMTGKKYSEETRKKMSEAKKKFYAILRGEIKDE